MQFNLKHIYNIHCISIQFIYKNMPITSIYYLYRVGNISLLFINTYTFLLVYT